MQKKKDEELLREFEWAKEHIANKDVPQPDPNELKMNLKEYGTVFRKRKKRWKGPV